ncbi:SRPBCC family protein [Mycobacterium intracellulare]|uniref:SRPBCC family protein n=1 Tax=Mycobacterium intracellulare TaxID=1767 RepID=UPI002FDE4726
MQLTNEFVVDTGISHAWEILTDIQRIAPCLPGATLEGRDGEDYFATVKVKVGPVSAQFQGSARFTHSDSAAHCAVVSASGKDPRGAATAAAEIQFRLESIHPQQTRVVVNTELDITGRIAQFGRGAIADVSNRLLGQFVDNLSVQVLGHNDGETDGLGIRTGELSAATAGRRRSPRTPQPASQESAAAELDVMALILPEIKKRYGRAILGAVAGFALSWLVFGRRVNR